MTSAQRSTLAAADCEVAFDDLTRQLYATDASLYQLEPAAVAFPRSASQASSIIMAAVDAGAPITPRGAGTGLSGGAIGDGLIVEFSRYNRQITELNLEARTVRSGAGVVLDQLNAFLKPHGFCFGPDVATSSRATIGGMIANDSSGAHVPVYGTTADHIVSQELVMADGAIQQIGPAHDTLKPQRELIGNLIAAHASEVDERMPPGLQKRWSGYALVRWLRDPGNLNNMLCGSEGTLAAIFSAELKIVPLSREKGLGLVFFSSVAEAMQATVELLELKPSAIEHIDRPLFDQTKGQLNFEAARQLLELDSKPCESILIVEFYDDVTERLALLSAKRPSAQSRSKWTSSGRCAKQAFRFLLDARARPSRSLSSKTRQSGHRSYRRMSPASIPSCDHWGWRSATTGTPRPGFCTCGPCSTCTRQAISRNTALSPIKSQHSLGSSRDRSRPSTA
jgi:FAD/FMN-containing dehydrogenase